MFRRAIKRPRLQDRLPLNEVVRVDPGFVFKRKKHSANGHNLEELVFGDDPEYLIDKFQTPSEQKRKRIQAESSEEDVDEDEDSDEGDDDTDDEIDDSDAEIDDSDDENDLKKSRTGSVEDSEDSEDEIEDILHGNKDTDDEIEDILRENKDADDEIGGSDDAENIKKISTRLDDADDGLKPVLNSAPIEKTEKEKKKEELKAKHIEIYGVPAWAKLDQDECPKTSKSDISDDDDDDILQQADDYLLPKCETLSQGIIGMRRMTNLNDSSKAEGSVIRAVEFHPSATVALVAGKAGIATLFQVDGKTNPKIQSIKFNQFPIATAHFSANGHEFIVGSFNTGRIYYYDMIAGKVCSVPSERDMGCKNMGNFTVSPDNQIIAFHGTYGRIHLLTAKSKEWIGSLKMNSGVRSLAFNKDGSRLYAHGNGGEVYIFDMKTRDCIHKFYDDGCVKGTAITVSPDNSRVVCGSNSGVVNVYDSSKIWTSAPKPSKIFLNLTTSIFDVKINHSNEFMVMTSDQKDNAIKLAHLQSMTVFSNFPFNHLNMKRPLCFDMSLNSGYLAIANNCSKVFLFRLNHYKNF